MTDPLNSCPCEDRVSELELDSRRLEDRILDLERAVSELQRKVSELDTRTIGSIKF